MKSIWVGIKRGTLLATGLRAYAADPDLQQEWMMVKKVNKMRLAEYIEAMSGVKVSLDAMFDVHTKRIHEYKRQLLNILGIIHRYDCIEGAITILQHYAYLVHLLVTFINNLSDDLLLKTLGPNFRSYFYRAFHQFKRVFAEFKRSHHELLEKENISSMFLGGH
ncbi:glycogen phosphorylase 1 [Prunus yedoensis var. nudiflora]|uniref:Alpha-1,4 glucan phosphorylase n=1 Tax=Prunus yedoensis var. nudiflora TaxID=2094558 RepID=A0A314ZQL1_PRUYE|nr:glycogen phosphorylase 1 [Prunus yedoensis var. nudiflora]PQQ20477.1 glycogen phosphorylase 1 [Prunus yedoensis var. nudiflora]